MPKSTILTLLLLLTLLDAKAQPKTANCPNFTGGAYYIATPHDTNTIVYRGLQYWIEARLKDHTVLLYKINWTNPCNFTLNLDKVINQDRNQKRDSSRFYPSPLSYSLNTLDSTGITYNIQDPIVSNYTYSEKLIPLVDTIAWQYLIYADTNLYFDSTEIKKLYCNPSQNYMYNVPYYIAQQCDSAETQFVSYVLTLFQKGDIKPAFDYATPKLHNRSPQSVIDAFNQYVQNLFGKMKSYQATSITDGYRITKDLRSHTYIITGQFENINGPDDVCISIAPGSANPLIGINMFIDSLNRIPFLKKISAGFWKSLKQKKYKAIYDSSSSLLKSNVTFEDAQKTLTTLDSLERLGEFKLYFQNFSVVKDKGIILLSYKEELHDKPISINLIFTFEDGEYKLAGLTLPKKQP